MGRRITAWQRLLAAAACAAAVAACNRAADPGTIIAEADAPHMKPGLWRQSYSFDSAPTTTRVLCNSGASLAPPRLGGVCSKYELRRTSTGGLIADSVCTQDGLTATMHSEDSGDFSRHFTEDNSITNGFPGRPTQTSRGHFDSEYLGPCPSSGADPGRKGVAAGR